jgi:molybdenum cofactor guanylyltransferase
MGRDKAALPWHGTTLLERVAGLAGRGVDGPVVVVGAPEQTLPAVPGAEHLADPVPGRGPLQGLVAGLGALRDRAEAAFVTGTDLPLLHPRLVRQVLAALAEGTEAAVAVRAGRRQPLVAAYRVGLADRAAALLEQGAGPTALLAASTVRELDESVLLSGGLAAVDPGLRSLDDVDDPAAYRAALALPAPTVRVLGLGPAPVAVRAWTVGEALAAAGGGAGPTPGLAAGTAGAGAVARHPRGVGVVRVHLDGAIVPDATPLAAGDELAVLPR